MQSISIITNYYYARRDIMYITHHYIWITILIFLYECRWFWGHNIFYTQYIFICYNVEFYPNKLNVLLYHKRKINNHQWYHGGTPPLPPNHLSCTWYHLFINYWSLTVASHDYHTNYHHYYFQKPVITIHLPLPSLKTCCCW